MNDIKLSSYAGFEKRWSLVTVRYRTDSGEMRFVYANSKAMKALQAGGHGYPDGSVFAKIGLGVEDDPAFPSSKVPSGSKRFQFMVRDAKKYAETGGWGYALFDPKGETFPSQPVRATTQACFACHQLVKDREYVFSQVANLSSQPGSSKTAAPGSMRLNFSDKPVKDLPEQVRLQLSPSVDHVRFLEGPLREKMFQGTLDEIRPALLMESKRTVLPSLFLSQDNQQWSMTLPVSLSLHPPVPATCKNGNLISYIQIWTVSHLSPKGTREVEQSPICQQE